MTSLLPTPEPPDPVEGALGHFEHSNWVKASLKALDEGTVHSNGGVATGTLLADQVTIDNPEDQTARLNLKGNSTKSVLAKTSADLNRWQLVLGDSTAEGGNHSGSLFNLFAYADDGALRHTVLKADRNSGLVEVKGNPTAAMGVATKEYVDNAMPIGTIVMFGGSTVPSDMLPYWQICNGTPHGQGAGSRIQSILGSANVPDLSGKFIVATGAGYNPKDQGGLDRVRLSAAESGTTAHGHGTSIATSSVDTGHDHGGGTGYHNTDHRHSSTIRTSTTGQVASGWDGAPNETFRISGGSYWLENNTSMVIDGGAQNHAHSISWAGGWHSHTFTPQNATAAQAAESHENRPPYYALIYIIKKA